MSGSTERIGASSGSVIEYRKFPIGLSGGSRTHEAMTAPKTMNE